MYYLRRSATEAQLGLEFGGVSKMDFEFEFLFQPGLKRTFELEFEFDFELELELASSSIYLPAFLRSVKETTAALEKTLAELNFHINFVRKLHFRYPKFASK